MTEKTLIETIHKKVLDFTNLHKGLSNEVNELLNWIITETDRNIKSSQPIPITHKDQVQDNQLSSSPSLIAKNDHTFVPGSPSPTEKNLLLGTISSIKPGDLCICYSVVDGEKMALSIEQELRSRGVDAVLLPLSESSEYNEETHTPILERMRALVLTLSPQLLQLKPLISVAEKVIQLDRKIILIHNQENRFPGEQDQPICMRTAGVFHDKAIPYMRTFESTTVNALIKKMEKHDAAENIETRAFLSHKRSSAQGMAGRLHEGLKGYRVFLDSEADFDLHDLQEIVKNTRLFIFILSQGIFESFWCMQELRSAIKFNRPIVLIRDIHFEIPNPLPEDVADLSDLFQNSPIIHYVAEFFQDVVKKLKEFMGPSDIDLKSIELEGGLNNDFIEKVIKNQQKDVETTVTIAKTMSLFRLYDACVKFWNFPIENFKKLSVVYHKFDLTGHGDEEIIGSGPLISKITKLELANISITDIGLKYIADHSSSNFTSLNLLSCDTITDDGVSYFLEKAENINDLKICHNNLLTPKICNAIAKKTNLTSLTLEEVRTGRNNSVTFTDESIMMIVTQLINLKNFYINGFKLSDDVFRYFPSSLQSFSYRIEMTDTKLENLCRACPNLKFIEISSSKLVTDAGIAHITNYLNELKKLRISMTGITDQGLKMISESNFRTKLKELWVQALRSATDKGMEYIAKSCPNLQVLNLGASPFTDETLMNIHNNCPLIRQINIVRCKGITENTKALFDPKVFVSKMED